MTDWGRIGVWIWIVGIVLVLAFAAIPMPPKQILWVGVG